MHTISVIIPVYNASQTVAQTLKALQVQTFSPIEVIVVDDGSTDSSAAVIQSFPNVKYFYQQNSGPASARNYGAAQASGEIIFFTDADCVPQKNWVERMLQGFQSENIAVVCGSYGIANSESLLARVIHQEILFRHHRLMSVYPKVFGSYNFAIKKKIFEEVGGFNTQYRNASGEDNDLSYKIINAGYKIFFKKSGLVDHYHTTRLGKYLKEQFRHGYWRVKMYRDYPKMMAGDGYTFWKDILEPPLIYFMLVSLLGSIFVTDALKIFLSAVCLFFLIEIFFGFVIMKNFSEGIYCSIMMMLRAFSRALGLSTGFLSFSTKEK